MLHSLSRSYHGRQREPQEHWACSVKALHSPLSAFRDIVYWVVELNAALVKLPDQRKWKQNNPSSLSGYQTPRPSRLQADAVLLRHDGPKEILSYNMFYINDHTLNYDQIYTHIYIHTYTWTHTHVPYNDNFRTVYL